MAEGGRGVAGPTRFACVRPPPVRRKKDRGRAGPAAPPLFSLRRHAYGNEYNKRDRSSPAHLSFSE
jgi:hypothetical protein